MPQLGDLQAGLPPFNKPIFLSRVKAICFCPHCSEGRPLPGPVWEKRHHGNTSRGGDWQGHWVTAGLGQGRPAWSGEQGHTSWDGCGEAWDLGDSKEEGLGLTDA